MTESDMRELAARLLRDIEDREARRILEAVGGPDANTATTADVGFRPRPTVPLWRVALDVS